MYMPYRSFAGNYRNRHYSGGFLVRGINVKRAYASGKNQKDPVAQPKTNIDFACAGNEKVAK